MNGFRFSLQNVLDWRRCELELEEAKLRRQAAAIAELDRARAELESEGIAAELSVRERRRLDHINHSWLICTSGAACTRADGVRVLPTYQ